MLSHAAREIEYEVVEVGHNPRPANNGMQDHTSANVSNPKLMPTPSQTFHKLKPAFASPSPSPRRPARVSKGRLRGKQQGASRGYKH